MVFLADVYDMYEEVEPVGETFIQSHYVTLKFVILFAILIVIGIFIIFHPTDQNKKDAKKWLEGLISKIYTIAVANIDYYVDDNTGEVSLFDYDAFKDDILQDVYKDAWDYVETSIDKAVSDGKLDYVAKRVIKKENVDKIVDLVMKRKDIQSSIKVAYETIINSSIETMKRNDEIAASEAAAAEAEPLDDDTSVEPEVVEAFADPVVETDTSDIEEPFIIEDNGSGAVEIPMEDGSDDGEANTGETSGTGVYG